MKQLYFAGCLAAAALLSVGLGACSSEEVVEEITSVEQQPGNAAALIDFGEFPAFGGATRANVAGKTGYGEGDEIAVTVYLDSNDASYRVYTYDATNKTWTPKEGYTALSAEKIANTIRWEAEFTQVHDYTDEPGTYECFSCQSGTSYSKGDPISIAFTREYSRVRIHTAGATNLSLRVSFTANGSEDGYTTPDGYPTSSFYSSINPDSNGDIFIYGKFSEGCTVNVESSSTDLLNITSECITAETTDSKTFTKASTPNVSYLFNTKVGRLTLDYAKYTEDQKSAVNDLCEKGYTCWTVTTTAIGTGISGLGGLGMKEVYVAEPITQIQSNCFSYGQLESITYSSSLKQIDEYAFAGTPLKSFTLSANPPQINSTAFEGCSWLQTITLDGISHSDLSQLGEVFSKVSSITKVICNIPDGENLGQYATDLKIIFSENYGGSEHPVIYVDSEYVKQVQYSAEVFTVKSKDEL
jgi:hypothetical protein